MKREQTNEQQLIEKIALILMEAGYKADDYEKISYWIYKKLGELVQDIEWSNSFA